MRVNTDHVPVRTADRPGVAAVLAAARAGVRRYDPAQTLAATARGALVVDTRTEPQHGQQGELPGALVIDRTVLEWRLDPASDARIPEATGYDLEVVVVCRQGYSSSLAAASLRAVGLHRPTCASEPCSGRVTRCRSPSWDRTYRASCRACSPSDGPDRPARHRGPQPSWT